MSAGAFALLVVLGLFALAGAPLFSAYRARMLFATDVALLVVPAPLFLATLLAFNEPAQIGWAPIAYPFVALALSVVALHFRVYVLGRTRRTATSASLAFFVLGAAIAVYVGLTVPPFHE